ncbi:MAG: carboxylesterase family protein [Acidobacteriia bacterium]|nr:carboxylesterase family protein [Terriglobia bacterium]
MRTLRATLFLATFAVILPLAAAIPEPVHTANGLVSGVAGASPEVRVFKGIPFAVPPVGDLRWRAPKAAANWEGVRKADEFAPICVQRGGGVGGARNNANMSEDCLYLNVYTSANSAKEKRAVMVWIHGGALTSGAGSLYDGEALAKKGVVVVTVNYRLGIFGFFAHPELTKESDRNASGNYGLLDQIQALEWVQKNIAAFGGDPKRVTIFGESAGSWSVNYLTATPLARGLFQRAIGESGGEFAPARKLADLEQAGVKLGQTMNATSIAALRAKSSDDLMKVQFQTAGNVDGWFLPQDVFTIYSTGKQSDVPTIIGSNNDEGTMFTRNITAAAFRQTAERRFGSDAEAYLKLYPAANDQEAFDAAAHSMRDQTFGWEMRTWAREQTKTGKSKVYMYYFSRVPPGENRAKGAFHGSEISYVFGNLLMAPFATGANEQARPWTDIDRKLADTMSSYWVNLAITGNPNGKGLAKWPAYSAKDDQAMGFGDSIGVMPLPHKEALDFLDNYTEHLRQTGAPATR